MSEKESKPPDNTKPSNAFLLVDLKLTRLAISKIEVKGPFSLRSATIASTALAPTPFMAPIPKRIAPSLFTANL